MKHTVIIFVLLTIVSPNLFAQGAKVITGATINAARMLGREKDSGTIEEGKVADLLILDANPLDDIRNIKQIHRIIKGGIVFDPSELLNSNQYRER